ncbi:MAG: hypothetical protein KAI17_03330 [Thiotrichaceae bacterium]|nr:hypothetical protein [Thiotrichaceae bacterium]
MVAIPKPLTDEQLKKVEELAPFLSTPQLADYFMIEQRLFREILVSFPNIRAVYKKARTKQFKAVGGKLLKKIADGDNASIFFYLKTQAKWRERDYSFSEEFQEAMAKLKVDDLIGRQACILEHYLNGSINEYQFDLLTTNLKSFADNVLYPQIKEVVQNILKGTPQ